jgi:hypothetical protein
MHVLLLSAGSLPFAPFSKYGKQGIGPSLEIRSRAIVGIEQKMKFVEITKSKAVFVSQGQSVTQEG